MTELDRTALLPYSAEQMYELVCDIESYPKFLPWCDAIDILEDDRKHNIIEAKLYVKKGFVETSFSTRNTLKKNISVDMSLLDGPFEFLEGNWTFVALDENACKVELKLSYRFANRAFSMALKPIFTQIGNMMLDAFCERAKQVYAKVPE
jgi:ribosome-associated toxin RatA of RatAB toxin-antitoxin module